MDWRHHGSFAVKVGLGLPLEGWVELDSAGKMWRKEQSICGREARHGRNGDHPIRAEVMTGSYASSHRKGCDN